jgi:superfamily II helicase
MKLLSVIFFLITASASFAQQTDEVKLIATVKEFHAALVKKNTVSINQQTDKALSYGHSNGWVQSKKEMIQDFESGRLVYKSFKEDSITVLMNEGFANVRFVADIEAALNGVENRYHLKVLEVWIRKSKRWVLFARQAIRY